MNLEKGYMHLKSTSYKIMKCKGDEDAVRKRSAKFVDKQQTIFMGNITEYRLIDGMKKEGHK